ncbi:hypothetical protein Scep_009058 [Stephania cephalantha]|uniref:Bidirectional sugar transporter SWEET n=1 Tax=Stephania cephalantha TaxID=152367 RepID=A0AAP0JSK2_9MAGN
MFGRSRFLGCGVRLTFKRVIKDRSTGEFSCVPYITAWLNCLIYAWYASPFVSNGWENLPLFTIDIVGIALESSFIMIYILYAPPRGKRNTCLMATTVIAFVVGMVIMSSILSDPSLRKALIGAFGLVACSAMYSSPLVVVKRVIQTKSVEFMPFSLSLFSFLASSLWTAYGLLSNDLLLAFPNILGCPLGLLQLLLYFKYSGKRGQLEEPLIKVDIEEACAPFLIHTKEEQEPIRFDVVVEDIEAPSLMLNVQHTGSFIDYHISEIRVDLSSPLLVSVCA